MDGAGPTQWESGAEEEFPPRLRRRTRLHEEVIDPTRLVQSGSTSVNVVDMTVADSDPDSEINNRMADLGAFFTKHVIFVLLQEQLRSLQDARLPGKLHASRKGQIA